MITTYLTKQGDMLDDVVFRFYGDTSSRIAESVLERNRGLADFGPVMPAGLSISLPQRTATAAAPLTRLWD